MKRTFSKLAASAAALIALAQPQLLAAQDCVDQEALSDATIYAMPLLYTAFSTKCGSELSETGFLATEGEAFIAPYQALQDDKWSGAFVLLQQFGKGRKGKGNDEMLKLFSSLPEEAMRPFVDAIIQQKVAEEIKVKDCGKIERGVEALAPLPPENMGSLLSFIMDMSGVKNPSLCPYDPE
ncbi:hypothetical protein [Pontixanthobacter aquaemixtae]|uniref:Uncharacterized protein n=1 Tax=Pontixanthobacter aquaemixtae TaxID=1958940 RepID=A0A844ZPJ8_9SPHN|nr:hypothetical protein [Pontixanthobacter aquaemixtae]MXO90281.1 hypothetical protein [Pontixanthobacter aquaemixtae]